jgi:hypothetical protein
MIINDEYGRIFKEAVVACFDVPTILESSWRGKPRKSLDMTYSDLTDIRSGASRIQIQSLMSIHKPSL